MRKMMRLTGFRGHKKAPPGARQAGRSDAGREVRAGQAGVAMLWRRKTTRSGTGPRQSRQRQQCTGQA